jgi:hypothetical protein
MTVPLSVDHLPKGKAVVTGQIHDDEDDVVMIKATALDSATVRFTVERSLGKDQGSDSQLLVARYDLGKKAISRIDADRAGIRVTINDRAVFVPKVSADADWYFKAGAYAQWNTGDDFAAVTIYRGFGITHQEAA